MKNKTPREYLLRVLGQWSAFCSEHRNFENAIKEILAENERLRTEIEKLKGK